MSLTNKIFRAWESLRTDGLLSLASKTSRYTLYHVITPRTPRVVTTYNGVRVRIRLGELLFPRYHAQLSGRPEYEEALVNGCKQLIKPGDTVVNIGAGRGVVAVHASRKAGDDGRVVAYEASNDMINILKWTIENNETHAPVSIDHAAVGPVKNAWGELGQPDKIEPATVPNADIYLIDIEGSELEVLPELPSARSIIVESHGSLGAPTKEVREKVENIGYNVVSESIADPDLEQQCKVNDVRVIVGNQPCTV